MIKENDFIEIEYTAIIKDTNQVIETTDEETAKKEDIQNTNKEYKPIIICVGQNQVPPGLDESFKGKKIEQYQIALPPEKAFGKKNPKLLQLVSQSSFKKQNIMPYPGLQINLDGMLGTVRTVTPGRVIVDFNHPLAGREIIYKVKIKRKITDTKEKLDSIISFYIQDFKTEIKEQEAIISAIIPQQLEEIIRKKVLTLIPTIKKITIKKE